MIKLSQRRLNHRFYGGTRQFLVETGFECDYYVRDKSQRLTAKKWTEKVQERVKSFELFPSEGEMQICIIRSMGCFADGNLFIFDDDSLQPIRCAIQRLFNILKSYPTDILGFMAFFKIVIKTKKIYLVEEDLWIPFKELDTEPTEKPHLQKDLVLDSPYTVN